LQMVGRVPSLSAVVPVYNSALLLPELVARLQPVLNASADHFEIVFVDDDSRDDN
jgi:glycosyltransferase involved in cell wall biosynthesis